MAAFDDLVAAVAAVDSEFQMSRIPFNVIKDGVLDCDARIKALEATVAALEFNSSGNWRQELSAAHPGTVEPHSHEPADPLFGPSEDHQQEHDEGADQ